MPRRRGRTVVRLNRVPFVEERLRVRAYRAGGVVVGRVILLGVCVAACAGVLVRSSLACVAPPASPAAVPARRGDAALDRVVVHVVARVVEGESQ